MAVNLSARQLADAELRRGGVRRARAHRARSRPPLLRGHRERAGARRRPRRGVAQPAQGARRAHRHRRLRHRLRHARLRPPLLDGRLPQDRPGLRRGRRPDGLAGGGHRVGRHRAWPSRSGFTVVAEGVETLFQMEALRELDCELAQGYLFSRPVPLDDAVALLGRAACAERAARSDRFSPSAAVERRRPTMPRRASGTRSASSSTATSSGSAAVHHRCPAAVGPARGRATGDGPGHATIGWSVANRGDRPVPVRSVALVFARRRRAGAAAHVPQRLPVVDARPAWPRFGIDGDPSVAAGLARAGSRPSTTPTRRRPEPASCARSG